ncbi:MAG: penicillin-binding protein 1C [Verrucomicrobiales bacterium]
MKRWFFIAGCSSLGALLVAAIPLYLVPLFVPLPDALAQRAPAGLLFVDREGRPVRRMLDGDPNVAPPVRADAPAVFEDFPKALVEATVAAEDSRFFTHGGIDFLGILRAVRDAVVHREFVSGASTITQQTVKLYSPPRKRTFRTKFIEAVVARKLEMRFDKTAILTAYLNKLPYGNQLTGSRAAARGYFGKPLSDLSVAEAALLAGLPNKPSRLNPRRNPNAARQRQLWVLGRMKKERFITESQFATALIEPVHLASGTAQTFRAPHFVELVAEQEAATVAAADSAGEPVRTTLDLDLQHFVESTVSAELVRLGHASGDSDELQAAVVVIETGTGDVLALTGSRSFFASASGQINGAWRPRSAGSALKPFTYLLALERGYTAATVLADTPIEYVTSTGVYQPVNFDRRFGGPVALRKALANSLNVPAVKTLDQLGGPKVLHELFTEGLGLTSLHPDAAEYGLGLTLGNAEVRLLELTNAYACLARLGEFKPYRLIHQGATGSSTLFDPDAAWLIADILSDSRARVEAFGLNSPLDLPFRAASKTGTSTDFRDGWTLGYTPDFTVGVWVGRFNNRPLNEVSGATGAAPIFRRVMIKLHENREPRWYDPPRGATELAIDPLNGKRVADSTDLPASRVRREWFVNGVLPPEAMPSDYTAEGKTRLPVGYADWWRSQGNELGRVAALESPAATETRPDFRIVSPLEGTVAFLDPDLPGNGARFPLRIDGDGRENIEWISESLDVQNDGDRSWVVLRPGDHEIVARDRTSGRAARTRFRVERL